MENKTNRVTKVQRFEDIVAMLKGEAVKYGTTVADAEAFVAHEVELLSKKNSTVSKKKSAEQEKDNARKALIVDFLASIDPSSDGMTCSDIGKSIDELAELSTSKMASLCNGLFKDGTIDKASVKGKTLFRLKA